MKKNQNLILSILSGLLLAASFPPYPFFPLAFVGFIPILYALTWGGARRRFLILYLTFFIYHVGTNWWMGSWQTETDPFLTISAVALAIVHPFFFMIPFVLFFIIMRRLGRNIALWLFPFQWTAFEWWHSLSDFSYPWLSIGYSQIYNKYWVQIVDITGIWGASFLIVLCNVLILMIMLNYKEAGLGKASIETVFRPKNSKALSFMIYVVIILPMAYGMLILPGYDYDRHLEEKEFVNIAVVQPNINPWLKWQRSPVEMIFEHMQLQDSLTKSIGKVDLGIWSETAVTYVNPDLNANHNYPFLNRWVNERQTPLMTGFSELFFYENDYPVTARKWNDGRMYETFNAVLMLNPDTASSRQVYRKMKLTPFAERIPHEEHLMFLKKFVSWGVGISSWGKGRKQHNLKFYKGNDTINIAPVNCIESIYPRFVSKFTAQGADVMSVITNDAWYDYTIGPEQHYLIAAMRAIENRRYIARCANTGVSGFIAPTGESIYRAEQYKKTAIAASIPLLDEKTIYVKWGDWLPSISTLIALLALIYGYIISRKKSP